MWAGRLGGFGANWLEETGDGDFPCALVSITPLSVPQYLHKSLALSLCDDVIPAIPATPANPLSSLLGQVGLSLICHCVFPACPCSPL